MRTSFVRYVSPTPRHTSFRKERAIVGAARGRSASAIPDLELIHPGVSDLNRETPFGNSTRILSVVVAHLHCADTRALAFRLAPSADARRGFGEEQVWHDRRLHTFADSKPGVAPCSSRGPASSAARSVWGV